MYNVRASGNPSSWQGPVWINVNYLVFRGLVKYGFTEEPGNWRKRPFCFWDVTMNVSGHYMNIICLIMVSRVLNKGFQNWNLLVLNMAAWLDGKPFVTEF